MRLPRSALYGSALYDVSLWGPTPAGLVFALREPWPGSPERGAALLAGEFRFAEEAESAAQPPWTAPRRPAFLAALHSFAWLADLAAVGGETAWAAARRWTAEWLQCCDAWDAVAWRADVTGDRLTAWVEHFEPLAGRADTEFRLRLLRSLTRQTRHLGRVVLREAAGQQRLAALRGLIVSAAALGNERRLAAALKQLERELAAQILPDGGHVERSPAAQRDALRYLVDIRNAVRALEREVPASLQGALDRAAPMLRFFRHGDGRLALFNGSGEDDVAALDLVLARTESKGRPPLSAPYMGFQRLQAGRSLVIADCGAPPPPGLDGDAHAGTLSFELSHGRERLIVNCGGYHGPSAQWRGAARATAAHSTLVVADTNSSELAGEEGLRRRPGQVTCERAEDAGSQWIAASHDGYVPPFGITHARQLFLAGDGEDLRGEDRLAGPAGQGFAIRFHLHPSVQASLIQDGGAVLLRTPSGVGWRLRVQGAVVSLAESVYLGQGERRKAQQIVLDGHLGSGGVTVKWALRREGKRAAESE